MTNGTSVVECVVFGLLPSLKKRVNKLSYLKRVCPECNRKFDLLNELDAEEWAYGHDCEEQENDDKVSAEAIH